MLESNQTTSLFVVSSNPRSRERRRLQGLLDDLRLWRVAPNQEEIGSTMNRRLSGKEAELVGYWKFDQRDSMQLIPDQTSNQNDEIMRGRPSSYNLICSDCGEITEEEVCFVFVRTG